MKLKTKLASLIIGFVMVASMLFFGVWAASSANVTLGGTISFSSTNVYAKVEATIENAVGATNPTTLEFSSKTPNPDTSTWTQNLAFDENGTEITITIKITNLATDRPLYASVTDNYGEVTNLTKSISNSSVTEIAAANDGDTDTMEVEIKLGVENTDLSLDGVSYGYLVHLDNEAPYTHEFMKYDSTENYYYLEMGTYNNAPVRWRYVSSDGETRFAASKENTPVTTAGSTGYFVVESLNCYTFDETSPDYSTSDIRAYLNGTGEGSFANNLHLDTETNSIYKKIKERTLADLANNAAWDYNSGAISDSTYSETTGSDRIWLVSVKELYTLICGGTVTNNIVPNSTEWTTEQRTNALWLDENGGNITPLWTRTAMSETEVHNYVSLLEAPGLVCMPGEPDNASHGYIAAFCLTF